MTYQRILTAALLLFVAAGIVTLVGKELRSKPGSGGPSVGAFQGSPPAGRQVFAYYFIGNVRCSSCRKIEELSRKTIEDSFRPELADGRLRFLVVNVDRPENRHFVEEFRIESSSLVLVAIRDGKPAEWKNLPDVWPLLDDEPKLANYVRDEVAARLKGI